MPPASFPSCHAPAERASAETVQRQAEIFRIDSFMRHVLDSMPTLLSILNGERQIVFNNRALLDFLNAEQESAGQGLRPGELFGCANARLTPGGCGTAEICRTCGAVNAILQALSGEQAVREYNLTRTVNGRTESLDLLIQATPLEYGGELFSIFSVQDISHQKRRAALERIFFHDILNLAGGVKGFAQYMSDAPADEMLEMAELIHVTSGQIVEEINAQRTLIAAENDDLKVECSRVNGRQLIEQIAQIYSNYSLAQEKDLVVAPSPDLFFESDATLLLRVLGNMLKNALEASRSGEQVRIGCEARDGGSLFWVHNPGVIPHEAQVQIFRRSFSTKGRDRGLGTYSIRLLTEGYLGGRVDFSSRAEEGTVFRAWYPLARPT